MALQGSPGIVIIEPMSLRKTPLYKMHRELGAKMIPFAGWEMPLQYTGIIDEHMAVRKDAGLFDVSHMGRIEVSGDRASEILNLLTTNDVKRLYPGRVQYTLLCNERGGVVDDLTLYMLDERRFLLCVNAVNTERVLRWMEEKGKGLSIADRSETLAQIAIQGPRSEGILRKICKEDLSSLPYYHFKEVEMDGHQVLLSRTGYTGEDGFEIYIPSRGVEDMWRRLLDAGLGEGLKPCGLGSRDTLRIEAGYCLYGHELDDSTTPLEACLDRFVCLEKDFIGREALLRQREEGVKRKLIGFRMLERAIPRQGYPIMVEGRKAGKVTSGLLSPVLGFPIGMGYILSEYAVTGREIDIVVRGKKRRAAIVERPFLRR